MDGTDGHGWQADLEAALSRAPKAFVKFVKFVVQVRRPFLTTKFTKGTKGPMAVKMLTTDFADARG